MGVLLPTMNQMFANQFQLLINFYWLHGGLARRTCHKETLIHVLLNPVRTYEVNGKFGNVSLLVKVAIMIVKWNFC